MRKLVSLALLIVLGFTAGAQADSTQKRKEVEIKVGEDVMAFEANVNKETDMASMVFKVTAQMMKIQKQNQAAMNRINELERSGELSPEEAETRRELVEERTEESLEALEDIMETWGEAYEARMEAWGEAYAAKMEAWEEEAEKAEENGEPIPPMPPIPPVPMSPQGKKEVRNKIVITEEGVRVEADSTDEGDDSVAFELKEKEESFDKGLRKSKRVDRTEGYFDIHLGTNQQLEEGQFLIQDQPGELEFWNTSFNLGVGAKTRIGSPYSHFYIKYGTDFSWHNFNLVDDNVLDRGADGAVYNPVDSINFDENKYHIAYWNFPLMLQLDFSDVGEMDESWTFGLGGQIGFRINSKRELEYGSDRFDVVEETARDDFYTSAVRYGLLAQVGYGSLKLTASYDLNPFFRAGKGPSIGGFDYNMVNVTVGFTF